MTRREMLTVVREVLREEATIDRYITVLSVIDGKRNLANDQISQLFSDDVGGTFYIYTNEEGEYENLKPISKQDAYKYIDYYNARLKKDHKRGEKLGAELGVLGIESELQFNKGEFRTDPSAFSANENYADGKVKEQFIPSSLQNLVNDYLFFITMNFTHLEKTGKSSQDVAALTQMIKQAKEDVNKLKDLTKDQLEKNKNSILKRIHDMLTYIISRMKAHMRPEEYEKRRDRLNKLLVLYKNAAKVQENYADGKVKGKSRPGRVEKSGASCKGSVTDLRAKAKKYGGEKGKMYHWCANMKGGKNK